MADKQQDACSDEEPDLHVVSPSFAGAGVLGRRRQGLHVYYFIADKSIFNLCDTVCGSLRDRLEEQARALPRGRN